MLLLFLPGAVLADTCRYLQLSAYFHEFLKLSMIFLGHITIYTY